MRRVLVIGSGGSGKSTLSKRLGAAVGLPVIHLDTLYWSAGWVEPDKAHWAETVRGVIDQEAWVLDGNYSGTLAERIEACDTVVFLDLSRLVCLWRVLKRVARYRGTTRPEMPAGCLERFDIAFLMWIWNYPNRSRRRVLALLERYRATRNIVHLRTRTEVERFVAEQRSSKNTVQAERQRLADAIGASDSKVAVHALADALRAEGMSQVDMYRLFAEQQQRLSGDDPRYDVVTEAMDLIWGGPWAKGRALFDNELTDADLERS